jgi:hypothetical protein
MNREEYNGWTNYETWLVNLWLSNEQGIDNFALGLCGEAETTREAADRLREWIGEGSPDDCQTGLYGDLLNAALSEVDWYEIADHYRERVEEWTG